MFVTPWLRRLKRTSGSGTSHTRVRPVRPATAMVESLEDRTLLAVGSMFIQATGTLVVVSDAADSIAVTATAGQVRVNGASSQTGPLQASSVQRISVTGGQGANAIDLSAVQSADFAALSASGIEVHGGDGADTITASPIGGSYNGRHGNDVLIGNAGNDTLEGDDGHDTITGNDGDDLLIGEDGDDVLGGGAGTDTLDGGDGTDSLSGGFDDDDLSGGNDSDTLLGEAGDDLLNGGFSDDTLDGGDGNDALFGGAGDDLVDGSDGDDRLNGNAGEDTLDGGDGSDTILGGVGDDSIRGGAGTDSGRGEDGNDTLAGGPDSDALHGDDGRDSISGDDGADSLFGGPDNDTLLGGSGDDTAHGQAGNDTLIGQAGADSLDGGSGNDRIQSDAVEISIMDASVVEGDFGTTEMRLTVVLSEISPIPVMFTFQTFDTGMPGSAVAGQDYETTQGMMVFTNDETTKTIVVSVIGDVLDEFNEPFLVRLTSVEGATVADSEGTGTIIDDDDPPTVSIDDVTIAEGDAPTTVFFDDFDGGQIVAPGVVPMLTGPGMIVPVQGYSGIGTGPNTFSGNFLRNDSGGTAQNPGSVPQVPTTLTLMGLPPHASIDLNFLAAMIDSWGRGTQNDPPDFFNVTVDGQLIFNGEFSNQPGEMQGYVPPPGVLLTPQPFTDLGFGSRAEDVDSAYNLGLDAVSFDAIPHTANTLTIEWFADGGWQGGTDESWAIENVEVILNPATVVNQTAAFTVSLSAPSEKVITVDATVTDGTAVSTGPFPDYQPPAPNPQVFTFNPGGPLQQSLNVPVLGDLIPESDETFFVNLTATNATVVRQGVGVIENDDGTPPPPSLSISDAMLQEGDVGTTNMVFTVFLSSSVGVPVTVDYATTDGTATAGEDYQTVSATLTFPAGNRMQSITVPIIGDTRVEEDEIFTVMLTNGSVAISDPQGQGTIIDDDGDMLFGIAPFDTSADQAQQSTLVRIDKNSGAAETVGLVDAANGGVKALIGLANDPVNGFLYSVNSFGTSPFPPPQGIPTLFEINPATAEANRKVSLFGSGAPLFPSTFTEGGVAYDSTSGMLFVLESFEDRLYTVDLSNNPDFGRTTLLGRLVTGVGDVSALAFRNGTLYSFVPPGSPMGLDNHLITIGLTPDMNGRLPVQDVGEVQMGGAVVNFGSNVGLAYDPGIDRFYLSGRNNANLFVVDPSDVTTTMLVGATETDISGLTYVPPFNLINSTATAFIRGVHTQATGDNGDNSSVGSLAAINGPNDDTLLGGDGEDTLLAGEFDDSLNGGAGNDILDGGAGDDIMEGAAGEDSLSGGDGNDLLDGGRGTDTVNGDLGNDTITWESFDGSDRTDGGFGFDELDIRTLSHNDRITVDAVGDGRFSVHHRIPSDAVGETVRGGMIEILSIDSNGGADRITVGDLTGVQWLQQASIDAGRGSDLVDASGQANPAILVSVQGGTGADTVIGGAGDDAIDGGMGNDVLTGGPGADRIDGSDGVDKLFGSGGDDVLSGGDGRDFLRGEDGDDVLSGGNQNDDLYGGIGNDVLLGDAGDDSLFGETGNDTADGGDGADTVDGGDGNDLLDGSAGVDSLRGGNGNDTARGGADGDTIAGGAGDDSLLGGNGSIALLTDGNDFINGNAGDDTLLGEHGQDTLLGGAGLDDLDGGFGNDQLNGNAGNDSMRGGNGDDLMRGGMGNDTLNGGHGEDRLFGQGGNDGLSGHDGHDRVNGGGGADTLHGGDGDDTLRGGAGLDLLIGHDGNDNLNGQGGDPDTLVGQDAFDILDDNGGLDVKDNDFVFFAEWIDAA